jgi:hypothetical protein
MVVVPFEKAIPTDEELDAFGRMLAEQFIKMEIKPGHMFKLEKHP